MVAMILPSFSCVVLFTSAVGLPAPQDGPPPAPRAGAEPPPQRADDEGEERERGLALNEEGAFQGYTLFAPLLSKTTYLIDMEGNPVHTWEAENAPAGGVYLLEDGTLLRMLREPAAKRFHGGGIGGRVQRLAWDGSVVWELALSDEYLHLHHDLEPLPNGNFLAIAWDYRPSEAAIEGGRDPAVLGEEGFWPDAVLEIKPEGSQGGEVVWRWHSWDHLIQDFDPEKQNYGSIPDHPERIDINADHRDEPPMTAEARAEQEELERQMRALGYTGGEDDGEEEPPGVRGGDWLHTNSVAYLPGYDLIALSTPHLGEIWVIDHSTTIDEASWSAGGRWGRGGDLLWRWGNPKTYGAGGSNDKQLFYQHDPTWLEGKRPTELRLLVFNNGGGRPGGASYSSVEELVLPFEPDSGFEYTRGEPFGPPEPAWSFSDPESFYAPFISGAQRLPNGNTLVCVGPEGRFFEVTPEGEKVWEFLNPYGGDVPNEPQGGNAPPLAVFRATRLAPDHPGLRGRF